MRKWLFYLLMILLYVSTVWAEDATNRVLSLDGDGDYVEIAHSEALNAIGSQVTIEAWIKPTAFMNYWSLILFKGDEYAANQGNISYVFFLRSNGALRLNSSSSGGGGVRLNTSDGLAGNEVNSIHQDEYGNLWFATRGSRNSRPFPTPTSWEIPFARRICSSAGRATLSL